MNAPCMRLRPLQAGLTAIVAAALTALLAIPAPASAQDVQPAVSDATPPVFGSIRPALLDAGFASAVPPDAGKRACPGCPPRRPFWAIAEVFGVSLLFEGINLAFKPADEKIYYKTYPKIWWNNISYGFEWDDNTFMINQWGHAYQGSAYFNAGRANGLSFWESAPLAGIGALSWEYLAERHKPSFNDLITTTLGGMALGEALHRSAWLIRDTRDTGKSRMTREIIAAFFDPITGINRFIDRDALKVVEKPPQYVPSALVAAFDLGLLWRGEDLSFLDASGEPFLQASIAYGTLAEGRSKEPFDAFDVSLRMAGGGGAISEMRADGRLAGTPLGGTQGKPSRHTLHFRALMGYEYENNSAYQFGGQDFSAAFTSVWRFNPAWRLVTNVEGGFLVLGAIDSLYVGGEDRQYDFGPGLSYGGGMALTRQGHTILRANYSSVWLHAVDGAQADHWTQNLRLDLLVPINKRVGLGTTGEFIRRKSYYNGADDVLQRFPQVRAYVSWMY
jgi:hypothetical protein